jgi:hypothetical protein
MKLAILAQIFNVTGDPDGGLWHIPRGISKRLLENIRGYAVHFANGARIRRYSLRYIIICFETIGTSQNRNAWLY